MPIRRGIPADVAALGTLARRAKAHWPYPSAQMQAWHAALMPSVESLAASLTWVMEVEGEIAGFVQLHVVDGAWVLEHLWVDPAHMRRGIGRALLAHALGVAAELGAMMLSIDADPHAESFYVACGAQRVGAVPAPIDGMPDRVRPQFVIATIHAACGADRPACRAGGIATAVGVPAESMRRIETQRLCLEPLTAAHAVGMFAVLSDPAIYEYENAPPVSLAWLYARYEKLSTRTSPDGTEQWLNWVIRLRDGALAGYVQATISPDGHAGIGYEFASRHWGRGLAGEAVAAMLAELAGRYRVDRFTAVLKRDNLRSLRLLQRLGFAPAGAEGDDGAAIEADEVLMAC
jgi:RimJ/RimL family protein N-acetyltransferase